VIQSKPPIYTFLSWHEFRNTQFSCQVELTLDRLRATGGGTLPAALETEGQLRAFADLCGIKLADPDVEPAVLFPHRFLASRDWVRGEYTKFLGFCQATGWLEPKRGPGRPRKTAAAA
jgi:hypothetical protein